MSTHEKKEKEIIDEYVQELFLLAKECNFQAVDVVQNRDNSVWDAFISGLRSKTIRQRLLENRSLDLNTAIDHVSAFYTAQKTVLLLPTILNHDVIFVMDSVTVVGTARREKARVTDTIGHYSQASRSRSTHTSASNMFSN